MTKQAWFCPACQRHHAPHVETCPKPADLIGQPLPAIKPEYLKGTTADPCAGCSSVCGNAFCPKRVRITCAAGALPTSQNVSYTVGGVQ